MTPAATAVVVNLLYRVGDRWLALVQMYHQLAIEVSYVDYICGVFVQLLLLWFGTCVGAPLYFSVGKCAYIVPAWCLLRKELSGSDSAAVAKAPVSFSVACN